MDWKEFFKPDLKKIVLTAILNLVLWPLPFSTTQVCPTCIGCVCSTELVTLYNIFIRPITWCIPPAANCFSVEQHVPLIIFSIIIVLAIYILSCGLIYLLNKQMKLRK